MKAYFDTMLWVYFFNRNPQFGPGVRILVATMGKQRHEFLSSYFVLGELLVGTKRDNDPFTAMQMRHFFLSSAVTLTPYSFDAVERFSQIRATTRVKPPDAQHLAVAAAVGADFFVTNDTQLLKLTVPGIGRVCTPEQLQQALAP